MTKKYQNAKQKAEELIDKFALTVPVQVFQLADLLGIGWKTTTTEELSKIIPKRQPAIKKLFEKYAPDDVLGFYDVKDNLMFINDTNQSITRKRFTMAHEIGHHQLHHGYNNKHFRTVFLRQDIFQPRDELEAEANYFAGYLLMPDASIEQKLKYTVLMIGGENIINSFARMFAISTDAMRIRLKTYKQEHLQIWQQYNLNEKLF